MIPCPHVGIGVQWGVCIPLLQTEIYKQQCGVFETYSYLSAQLSPTKI